MPNYATETETKHGTILFPDDDFVTFEGPSGETLEEPRHCLDLNVPVTVQADAKGELYVPCRCGSHYLDGQLENGHYIGLSTSPIPT